MHAGREWEALTKVKSWLAVTRRIDLLVTPDVKRAGRMACTNRLSLPSAIGSQLSDEELETLMMHELAQCFALGQSREQPEHGSLLHFLVQLRSFG